MAQPNLPGRTFDGLFPAPTISDGVAFLEDGGERIPLGRASHVLRNPRGELSSRLEHMREDYDPTAPEPTPNHDPRGADLFRRYLARHIPHNPNPPARGRGRGDQHAPRGRRARFERQQAHDEREHRRRARFPEPVGSDGLLETAEEESDGEADYGPGTVDLRLLPAKDQQAFQRMYRVFGDFVENTKQYTADIMALPEILWVWKKLVRAQMAKPLAERQLVDLREFLTKLVEVPLQLSPPKLINTDGGLPQLVTNAFMWAYSDEEREKQYQRYAQVPLSQIMADGIFVGFAGDYLYLVFTLELEPPVGVAGADALADIDFRHYAVHPASIGEELRQGGTGERRAPQVLPLKCRLFSCKLQWYTGVL